MRDQPLHIIKSAIFGENRAQRWAWGEKVAIPAHHKRVISTVLHTNADSLGFLEIPGSFKRLSALCLKLRRRLILGILKNP